MNIIDLTNLSHEELVEREMKEQNITREEAEKYWQNTYEAAKENQKQHDEFMEQYYNEKTADQLLSNRSSNLKIKITEFRKEYPDVSKFNLAKYLGDIYREEKAFL